MGFYVIVCFLIKYYLPAMPFSPSLSLFNFRKMYFLSVKNMLNLCKFLPRSFERICESYETLCGIYLDACPLTRNDKPTVVFCESWTQDL